MSDGEINQWASHLPALVAAAAATSGPILECGVGFNSTPVLHALCAPSHRPLLSLDGNPEWLARFQHLQTGWHDLAAADWTRPHLGDGWWSLAFVDHDHTPRGALLAYLREHAGVVVMHDSECHYCGYTEPLKSFDWVYTHTHSPAWTTLAGLGTPPAWLTSAITPGVWGVPTPYRG